MTKSELKNLYAVLKLYTSIYFFSSYILLYTFIYFLQVRFSEASAIIINRAHTIWYTPRNHLIYQTCENIYLIILPVLSLNLTVFAPVSPANLTVTTLPLTLILVAFFAPVDLTLFFQIVLPLVSSLNIVSP